MSQIDLDDGGGGGTEEKNEIPRLYQIPNPVNSFVPNLIPPSDKADNIKLLKYYGKYVKEILTDSSISNVQTTTRAYNELEQFVQKTPFNKPFFELIIHQYLLHCNELSIQLSQQPNLQKIAFFHHELKLTQQIIGKFEIDIQLKYFCDMIMAEVADLYIGNFVELVETKYWAKTKTVDDLLKSQLTKEIEKLRVLNDYSFNFLASGILRKCIDGAPSIGVHKLKDFAKEQKINV